MSCEDQRPLTWGTQRPRTERGAFLLTKLQSPGSALKTSTFLFYFFKNNVFLPLNNTGNPLQHLTVRKHWASTDVRHLHSSPLSVERTPCLLSRPRSQHLSPLWLPNSRCLKQQQKIKLHIIKNHLWKFPLNLL